MTNVHLVYLAALVSRFGQTLLIIAMLFLFAYGNLVCGFIALSFFALYEFEIVRLNKYIKKSEVCI